MLFSAFTHSPFPVYMGTSTVWCYYIESPSATLPTSKTSLLLLLPLFVSFSSDL